ncbi:hypothetical protein BAUCODRAFT_145847 [Baudoinia panamericana UAMH 10762]|uniref:TECPR1-like DysF domain-containing protein n=1 Tax=Baudoinia panamericana (strain UAMH 10762) TaxID=717646 RepID=M2LVY8_BAUPA|nr:uncharacterized protein BAUCODRAFT_145847 [Baudoinia panamericana UAMH 10762]EMC98827.1 hypothetical protein BAUCODRAFT_145847 [Baudoinia panamericana UAMH 10762]
MTGEVAHRDAAIPAVSLPSKPDKQPATDETKMEMGNPQDKLQQNGSSEARQSLQDRFFNGVLAQIIPTNDDSSNDVPESKKARGMRTSVDRPGFSIPLMSTNFRRFNARIGVVFVLQNRIIRLLTWHHATATLSFLAVYTLLCLQPRLLPAMPIIGLLLWIMMPSFLARHPAPADDTRIEWMFHGPPVAPPSRVRPAPELSKDFFRNMRDLQNSMDDYSRLHDAANEYITPYTNFSDEATSSALYMTLFVVGCTVLVGSSVVPWRLIALIAGWTATLFGHPELQKGLFSSDLRSNLWRRIDMLQVHVKNLIDADILLDSPSEMRQVEIFELQKYHVYSDTWEPWLFSPSPFEPLSAPRIADARAKGTQFFDDVQAPQGWSWKDKKWSLDLAGREWVEQRMITGVEVEMEGERWVYDLPAEAVDSLQSPTKRKQKERTSKDTPKDGWEEGTRLAAHGEWRRRRWVRVVERKALPRSEQPR